MRLIDADALYKQMTELEELARNRVLDTESVLPYPNNLNPSYTRYLAQMDERTKLKELVADAQTIEPERKKGKWIYGESEIGNDGYYCSVCGNFVPWKYGEYDIDFIQEFLFCNKCGADMRGDTE